MPGRGTAFTSLRSLRWWGCGPLARLSGVGASSKPAPPSPPRRSPDATFQKDETLPTQFSQNMKDVLGNPLWICRGSVNHYKTAIFSGTYRRSFVSAAVNFPRSPTFSKLTKDDIDHFKNILGDKYVIQEEGRLSTANLDWMRKYRGLSQLLLLPRSTKELQKGGNYILIIGESSLHCGPLHQDLSFICYLACHILISFICHVVCYNHNILKHYAVDLQVFLQGTSTLRKERYLIQNFSSTLVPIMNLFFLLTRPIFTLMMALFLWFILRLEFRSRSLTQCNFVDRSFLPSIKIKVPSIEMNVSLSAWSLDNLYF